MTKKSEPNQLRRTPALILALAIIRTGFRFRDRGMVKTAAVLVS